MLKQILLMAVLAFPAITAAQNQSFCALRDPSQYIYRLFPQANSYRSLVKNIDEEMRFQLATFVPLTLHPNEVGKHTLYLVWNKEEFLGLVHARSESSKWGMVEIAWALDSELRIVDFLFVRCRDSNKKYFEEDNALRNAIIGADANALNALLSADRQSIIETLPIEDKAHDLGRTLIHNAIKTIGLTRLLHPEEFSSAPTPPFSH
jgi:hypothetical protein